MKKPLKYRFGAPKPMPKFDVYHVYDPNAVMLARTPVSEDRTVRLTPEDAAYWLAAGTIGTEALDKLDEKSKEGQKQMLGMGTPLEAAKGQEEKDPKEGTAKAYDAPAKQAPAQKGPVTHQDSVRG